MATIVAIGAPLGCPVGGASRARANCCCASGAAARPVGGSRCAPPSPSAAPRPPSGRRPRPRRSVDAVGTRGSSPRRSSVDRGAAVLGACGHLSGPFAQLDAEEQERAILSLLELREDLSLPDPRLTVPAMAKLAGRHPDLNLLNLEAVAVGRLLAAVLWLSPESTRGVLPGVLDDEGVAWRTITIP